MSAGDERGRPGREPETGPGAQQASPDTANSVHGTAVGLQQAVDHADPWWMSGALQLIAMVAAEKTYVCACDLAGNDLLGDPDHAARYGAAFHLSVDAGVIEYVAHHRARRSSRHGGVHSVWRATR